MTENVFSSTLQAINYFESSPILAIAVSGGADSMALLLLVHEWAKKNNGQAVALTVDHGLRKESAAEAKQVKRWCNERNIEHHTLTWERTIPSPRGGGLGRGHDRTRSDNAPLPTSRLRFAPARRVGTQARRSVTKAAPLRGEEHITQAAARDARYALLTDWCKKNNVLHLLTAHHQGDQAETLIFRLARGSNLDGLASIPAVSTRHGVRLIRPLLALPKSALENYLQEKKQSWLEDPTNATAKYARNVIRAELTPAQNARASALAQRIGTVRNNLEHRLAETMIRTISIFPEGYAMLFAPEFKALPAEYGIRTLAALVQTIGGDDTPPASAEAKPLRLRAGRPRTKKLERLYADLQNGKTRTLGGCLFRYQSSKKRFLVKREQKTLNSARFKPLKPLAGAAFFGLNSL